MKRLMFAAAALVTLVAPVRAQQLDLSTITCKQFVTSEKETIALILMWMEGYYSDSDAKPIVDFDKMKENGEKLGEYCGKNPSHSLITASDDIMKK